MRASDRFDQNEVRQLGFKRWCLDWDYPREVYRDNRHVQQFGLRNPQLWWLDGCDFIGRFERLQEDFNEICGAIGLGRRAIPHINASQRPHYREFYDCETAAAVAKWFLPDVEAFSYDF